jgi:WD40 repeat protein
MSPLLQIVGYVKVYGRSPHLCVDLPAAAAIANLNKDPERSVLLALHAMREAHTREAEEVLHLTLPNLRVLQTMDGHEDVLREVEYSPDGSRLVTTSDDGTARVWNTSTGQELLLLAGHEGLVGPVTYSMDGAFIVTAGADGTAIVWDAATGKVLHMLDGHRDNPNLVFPDEPNWVGAVAVSPESTIIATGSADGTAKLWDASSGEELKTYTISDGIQAIQQVAFGPDGSWLAMWGTGASFMDNVFQIIDVDSGSELLMLAASPEQTIGNFAINPDGTRLLIGDAQIVSEAVHLWDLETETELVRYPGGEHNGRDFSPDGTLFATSLFDGGLRIWETDTGHEVLKLSGHQGEVLDVRFSPDGASPASASTDGSARIWDIGPSHEILTLQPFSDAEHAGVTGVEFNPGGTMLAAGGFDGGLSLWDPETGDRLRVLPGHDEFVGGLSFSPEGARLASASDDRTIKLWNTETGELLLTMNGHEDWVNNLAYSPDGATLATVGADKHAFIWDAVSGRIMYDLPLSESAWGIAYCPDGALLATGDSDGNVTIWDVTTREMVQEIDNETGADDVYFTPDGSHLIAVGMDGSVKIWDPNTGSLVNEFQAHQGLIWGLAISPDGSTIATASADKTARLWDAQSGERLLTLEGAALPLGDVEFTPDGSQIAVASNDGTVRFYMLPADELLSLAQARVTRSLTDEECQQYLHVDTCP